MIILGPIVGIVALWLTGALALTLIGARREAGLYRLTTDLVAGVVVLTTLGMTALSLGVRVTLPPFYLVLVLMAITVVWRDRRAIGPSPLRELLRIEIRPPHTLYARGLLVLVGLLLLALAISASQDRLVWDGWAFWTLKARILFLEGTLPPATFDPAGPYPYAHPEYPLAVPLLDWWLYRHAGRPSPALASLAGVLWFATLPVTIWAALRPHLDELTTSLATLGITAFWPLAFYASGGYADIVISLALLGVVIELERARRDTRCEDDVGSIYRLALYLTLGALAKNEGLALAAIGALVAIIAIPRQRIWQGRIWRGLLAGGPGGQRRGSSRVSLIPGRLRGGAIPALVFPFLALAPWFIATRRLGLTPQHLSDLSPTLAEGLSRIPTILTALTRLLFTRAWIPLPFLVAIGLLAAARRGRTTMTASWTVIGGYALVILGVYLTTPLEIEWLLSTTLDRMVGHLVPALIVLSLIETHQCFNSLRMTSASSLGLE